MRLYRGLSKSRGDKIVAGTEAVAATSNGEFGAGSYYWKDSDGEVALYAGVISALQYYGSAEGGWALLEITVDEQSVAYKQFLEDNYTLDFTDGKPKTVYYEERPGDKTISSPVMGKIHGMDLQGFVDLNEAPERIHLPQVPKKQIPWMRYPMIMGPTVAAAANSSLIQIKFNGNGLTLLNTKVVTTKRLILSGDALPTGETVVKARIDNLKLTSPKRSVTDSFPRIAQALQPLPAAIQALGKTWWSTT